MRLKTKSETVHLLLVNYPHLRDDDNRLIASVWKIELRKKDLTAIDFLQLYASKKVTNAESIRRCRQKLQELHPDLRGNKYNLRHKSQTQIKQQLKNW